MPATNGAETLHNRWPPQKTIVILDDDPTGTQTVRDLPVLTVFTEEAVAQEVQNGTPCFFILTNSRSLTATATEELHHTLGKTIQRVFGRYKQEYVLISRADSTLRGHFPTETKALAKGAGLTDAITVLIPAFFEGGRYTINDLHYLKVGEDLVPVGETDFARDHTFGYRQSHLPQWVEEKTGGDVNAADVVSVSIAELRNGTTAMISQKIAAVPAGGVMVVNAAAPFDLAQFAQAFIQSGAKAIFRTAASFINALTGTPPAPLLPAENLCIPTGTGGLIVVGSHVQKTNRQLLHLLSIKGLVPVEFSVEELHTRRSELAVREVKEILHDCLEAGRDVVLFTSRQVAVAADGEGSLQLSASISAKLVEVVASLPLAPRFFISKGGITSSDLATKALQIRRATVLGQALPGVPVWAGGPGSRFPHMPYIIFPGNVGSDEALGELYRQLKEAGEKQREEIPSHQKTGLA